MKHMGCIFNLPEAEVVIRSGPSADCTYKSMQGSLVHR